MLDAALERSTPLDVVATAAVDDVLLEHVRRRGAALQAVDPTLAEVVARLGDLARGGKRLRAAFCLWGARIGVESGRGPAPDSPPPGAAEAAAALEMFHLAALVHDDVMDRSETRRGVRATHHHFAEEHRRAGSHGDARTFGDGVAVLVGDLCLTWSDDLLTRATRLLDDARAAAARDVWERMRDQVLAGQYLDLLHQSRHGSRTTTAARVLRYKSAKYTVEHPLLLGATLGGAPAHLLSGLASFGLGIGEAFQLRDDVLGLFGDPGTTGKPTHDDVREGKRTMLVAHAEKLGDEAARRVLRHHLGDPDVDADGLRAVQDVVRSTGALDRVERQIAALVDHAHAALQVLPLEPASSDALTALGDACAWRAA